MCILFCVKHTYIKKSSIIEMSKETILRSVSEFNEFEPRLKSAKNRFQLSAGLNLEKLNSASV